MAYESRSSSGRIYPSLLSGLVLFGLSVLVLFGANSGGWRCSQSGPPEAFIWSYQDSSAGKHLFELDGVDDQDNASRSTAHLAFSVFTPTPKSLMLMTAVSVIGFLSWLAIRLHRERCKLIAQLSKASHEARTAKQLKSEFLAYMSHEIRGPMNGVIGMTDLALQLDLPADAREYLETVKCSGEALLEVIGDILDFSKIEAGKMELENVAFRLSDVWGDALRTMAFRAHRKGLDLGYEVAEGVPDVVLGDSGRLRQVILNLIGNAIKFTEHGEIFLFAQPEACEPKGTLLRFSVRDTGIGISPAKQQLVFDSFSQADGTARRYDGTGLGLTISKRLVAKMGGRIWLESKLHGGTTVHFSVKLGTPEAAAAVVEPPATVLSGLNILVLDQSDTDQHVIGEILGSWGIHPARAGSVSSALTLLEQRSFDLILLDMQIPGMDGCEFAQHLRERWPQPAMKIVALTPTGARTDRAPGAVIDASVGKPILSSELLETMELLLAKPPETIGNSAQDSTVRPPLAVDSVQERHSPSLNVLLAEDNPVNQLLVRRVLEKAGHTVVVAGDGHQAVKAFETGAFDLILMDAQMPGVDGLEATQAIRKQEASNASPGRGRIPIIALTAEAMAGDRERCLRAGMDGYISKPIDVGELANTIASVYAKNREDRIASSELERALAP